MYIKTMLINVLRGFVSLCFSRYIEVYLRCFNMSIKTLDLSMVTLKISEMLHPTDRELMANVRLDKLIRTVKVDSGLLLSEDLNLKNCITVLASGLIAVQHKFESKICVSHFYHHGDIIYDTEIRKDLNEMQTQWYFYEPSILYVLPLTGITEAIGDKTLFSKLKVQSALHSSYQYQKYINDFALNRKSFCVNWIRRYGKALSLVSRNDLALFFGISISSLKSYIKIATKHA